MKPANIIGRLSFAMVIAVLVIVAGCSKKADQRDWVAECSKADTALEKSTGEDSKLVANVTQACSNACDKADAPSCKLLDENLKMICVDAGTMGFCSAACGTTKSASLKERACKLSKTP